VFLLLPAGMYSRELEFRFLCPLADSFPLYSLEWQFTYEMIDGFLVFPDSKERHSYGLKRWGSLASVSGIDVCSAMVLSWFLCCGSFGCLFNLSYFVIRHKW
jgi:hypothetical protein